MKLRIIGGSGSGKSTLAQALGERYGVPVCDLDRLQWGGAYGQRRPEAERAAMLQEVLAQRDWIIEGVYCAWTAETFAQADAICLLEPPPALCRRRVIRRYYRRKRQGAGHGETLQSLRALLRWMDAFQTRNLPAIRETLAPYEGKTLRVTKAMPTGDILSALEDILTINLG